MDEQLSEYVSLRQEVKEILQSVGLVDLSELERIFDLLEKENYSNEASHLIRASAELALLRNGMEEVKEDVPFLLQVCRFLLGLLSMSPNFEFNRTSIQNLEQELDRISRAHLTDDEIKKVNEEAHRHVSRVVKKSLAPLTPKTDRLS